MIKGQLLIGENGAAKIESGFGASADGKTFFGTFVYGSVTAQKGADITITAEIMKDGVVDVTSAGKKVSKISGDLTVMPGASVSITGNVKDLKITATAEDKSKAKDKSEYLNAEMDVSSSTSVASASDASSITFTVTSESNAVYEKVDDKTSKKTYVAANLAIDGKVANAELKITKADSKTGVFSDSECKKQVEISASNSVPGELQIAKTGKMTIGADLDVSGKLTVLSDKTANLAINTGVVTVSGTVDAVNGSFITEETTDSDGKTITVFKTGMAILKIQGGTFTVANSSTTAPEFDDIYVFADFKGAYYLYGSTTTKFVACELDAAIAAVDSNIDEIHVCGLANDADKKKVGYVVEASIDVPAKVNLVVKNALVIGKDAVVMVPADATLEIEGIVYVDGKLIDKTATDYNDDKIISDVIVKDDEASIYTYTSLKIALSDIKSGKVELKNNATISEDMTIPAEITVVLNGKNLTVSNGVTLTVAGVIDATSGNVITKNTVKEGEKITKTPGKVVVDNMIILASNTIGFDEDEGFRFYTV